MLTVAPRTRSRALIDYITPMVGRMRYYVWPGGIVPDDHGPYAYNGPAPQLSYLRADPKIYCAGVPNLALRLAGKRIPIAQHQSALYDGGIAAYFGSPMLPQIGAGYFAGYTQPFDYNLALKWARETRQLVMIGWRYTGVPLAQQGHVALVLPSGYVLQSNVGDGLNWKYTLAQSNGGAHSRGAYTLMAHPRNWLEYNGDQIHRGGIWR